MADSPKTTNDKPAASPPAREEDKAKDTDKHDSKPSEPSQLGRDSYKETSPSKEQVGEKKDGTTASSEAVRYDTSAAPTDPSAYAQYAAYYQQAAQQATQPLVPEQGDRRLHISNLPFRIREPELKQLFEKYGTVDEVEIIYNERGSKGFGFVSFYRCKDAAEARTAMSGSLVDNRRVEVNWATRRNNDKPSAPKWGAGGAVGAVGNANAVPVGSYGYGYPYAAAPAPVAVPPAAYGYPYPAYYQQAPAWPYYDPTQAVAAAQQAQYPYNPADPAYAQWYAQYYAAAAAAPSAQQPAAAGGAVQAKDTKEPRRYQPY